MLCIPITGPDTQQALQQITEATPLADLLELRLDYFNDVAVKTVHRLTEHTSSPLIFTLRKPSQGGKYSGSEEIRFQTIRKLAALQPAYLDLEYDTPPDFISSLAEQFPKIKLILSYHNFSETPADLEAILRAMQHTPCHLYKIACTAHSTLDALRMLALARKHAPLLGVSMGDLGQPARILAPTLGSPWTYASLQTHEQTAPGQLTAQEMRTLYTFAPHTPIYGLIGKPISASIGHHFHNHAFQGRGIYVKMELTPQELAPFFALARTLSIQGLSVTMPLKEEVIPYLDALDPKAAAIGAVNTICQRAGKLIGFNTDAEGALDAIEKHMLVKNKKMVVIGSGGSARATIYEALQRGAHVLILNRTLSKAAALAHQLGAEAAGLTPPLPTYDILVNTTPTVPIPLSAIRPHTIVMDINILPSPLLVHASSLGCTTISGHEMFTLQAAAQQALWLHDNSLD